MKTNPTTPKAPKGKESKKKLVLLDAHAIIHRAYHALPEFSTSGGEPTGALYGLSSMLLKIIDELKPDFIVACFDLPGPTYRHEAFEAYKAGRAKTDDALVSQLERAKEVFSAFGIPIYSHPGFEADDIIGTIVHTICNSKFAVQDLEIIIATGDMDALQLVSGSRVRVYTLKKGINDTVLYDEKGVKTRFGFGPELLVDYKGLRGDPSDNIPGVKGIGEKTATDLIIKYGSLDEIYRSLNKGKLEASERIKKLLSEGEEEARFSKTLATIRKDAPINFSLPDSWTRNFEVEKALELFSKLEFRTMGDRVKKLVDKYKSPEDVSVSEEPKSENTETSSQEVRELCLVFWVMDSNKTDPDLEDVFRFAGTRDIKEAKKIIESELDARNTRKVFEEIEKPVMSIVERMNRLGIKVDSKFLNGLSKKYHRELSSLEKSIWKEAGEDLSSGETGFNINSPKILSEILFNKLGLADKRQKRTPTGALSTRESELEKLRDRHPIISLILEYRELAKLLSTYIDAIPPLLDEQSRLHSTFLQAGTTTGRMASNSPNLQNIPNRTPLGRAIRQAFIPEDGYKLVSLDYSQIELRIAAILSGDEKLIEIFKNGEDVHAGVASRVFGVPPEKVDKEMRIKAKTINFGILYGMGVNSLKANLGVDRKEAQEFYNEYFSTFTGLASYLEKVKKEAEKNGYTETMFGRRRYFSGFRSPLPYVRAQAERMAINAPIQGTQADLIKIAMKRVDDLIKLDKLENDARLVLQVHDELVYEMRDGLTNKLAKAFKEIMEGALDPDLSRGVPIIAGIEIGSNWGEMEKLV